MRDVWKHGAREGAVWVACPVACKVGRAQPSSHVRVVRVSGGHVCNVSCPIDGSPGMNYNAVREPPRCSTARPRVLDTVPATDWTPDAHYVSPIMRERAYAPSSIESAPRSESVSKSESEPVGSQSSSPAPQRKGASPHVKTVTCNSPYNFELCTLSSDSSYFGISGKPAPLT